MEDARAGHHVKKVLPRRLERVELPQTEHGHLHVSLEGSTKGSQRMYRGTVTTR